MSQFELEETFHCVYAQPCVLFEENSVSNPNRETGYPDTFFVILHRPRMLILGLYLAMNKKKFIFHFIRTRNFSCKTLRFDFDHRLNYKTKITEFLKLDSAYVNMKIWGEGEDRKPICSDPLETQVWDQLSSFPSLSDSESKIQLSKR